MRKSLRPIYCLINILAMLSLAACGDDDGPAIEDSPTIEQTATETPDPKLEITSPTDGGTVPAGGVAVGISATGFEIVPKLGQAAAEGEGHVHYYIDVETLPTEAGKPAVTTDKNTYHAADAASYTWPDVKAGTHTLGVQLVNNDHTPLSPPITKKITITVT